MTTTAAAASTVFHGRDPDDGPADGPRFGTGLLHRMVAHVLGGHDAIVQDPTGGGPVLDLLATALRARSCRVLRIRAQDAGRLSDVMAQITGEACDGVPDEGMLERSFDLLCTPGAEGGRIVLLVADAHKLGRKEFRYLHLAAKSGPLQFVLAAPIDPLPVLDGDLWPLQSRLGTFEPLVIEPGTPLATLIPSTPRPPTPRPAVPAPNRPAPNPSAPAPSAPNPSAHGPARRPAPVRTSRPRRVMEGCAAAAVMGVLAAFTGVAVHLFGAVPAPAAPVTSLPPVEVAGTAPEPSGPVQTAPAPSLSVPASPAARPAGLSAPVHRVTHQASRTRPPQLASE